MLRDGEVREICWRVDLAAARLRAMRLDLEALRATGERTSPGRPDPAWVTELLGIAALPVGEEQWQAFAQLDARMQRREQRMARDLFSFELRVTLDPLLARREAAIERAHLLLLQVRELVPVTKEGAEPSKEVAALRKSERYSYALRLAAEGLGHDPLQDELCYYAGLSSDFAWGARESRPFFDRFLALRGIRGGDERTYHNADRTLDASEQHALSVVQGNLPTPR